MGPATLAPVLFALDISDATAATLGFDVGLGYQDRPRLESDLAAIASTAAGAPKGRDRRTAIPTAGFNSGGDPYFIS